MIFLGIMWGGCVGLLLGALMSRREPCPMYFVWILSLWVVGLGVYLLMAG